MTDTPRKMLTLSQLIDVLFTYVTWPSLFSSDPLFASHRKRVAANNLDNYGLLHAHLSVQLALPVDQRTVLMTTDEIEQQIEICADRVVEFGTIVMELDQ